LPDGGGGIVDAARGSLSACCGRPARRCSVYYGVWKRSVHGYDESQPRAAAGRAPRLDECRLAAPVADFDVNVAGRQRWSPRDCRVKGPWQCGQRRGSCPVQARRRCRQSGICDTGGDCDLRAGGDCDSGAGGDSSCGAEGDCDSGAGGDSDSGAGKDSDSGAADDSDWGAAAVGTLRACWSLVVTLRPASRP